MTFRLGVIQQDGVWRLAYHGMQVGRFPDRAHAMGAAVRLAKMVEDSGGESEILMHQPPSTDGAPC